MIAPRTPLPARLKWGGAAGANRREAAMAGRGPDASISLPFAGFLSAIQC